MFILNIGKIPTSVFFSSDKVPLLASQSGSLHLSTNQSQSLHHIIARKKYISSNCIKETMINSKRLNMNICAIYFGYPIHFRILLPPLVIMVCIQFIILQCTCNVIFQVIFNHKDPWDHLMYYLAQLHLVGPLLYLGPKTKSSLMLVWQGHWFPIS